MKKFLMYMFCTLGLSLIHTGLFAQNSEKEALYFQTYTFDDGLSDNYIRDVTQDQQGYLWIATASGISRFDGYGFRNYRNDPGDPTSLSTNDTFKIYADRRNNIWIGTSLGLNKFDRVSDTFEVYMHDPSDSTSIPGSNITAFFESSDGTFWVGTSNGLASFNYEEKSFNKVGIDAGESDDQITPGVTAITESSSGHIYFSTFESGINILNPETGEVTNLKHDPESKGGLPNNFIFYIFIDNNEVLWVGYDRRDGEFGSFREGLPEGSNTGLWKKNLRTGKEYHYLFEPDNGHPLWNIITEIIQTRDGRLWFSQAGGAPEGLRYYNPFTDSFHGYIHNANNPGSIAWNYATNMLEDTEGNFWLGTSRGLSRANRQQLQMQSFVPDPQNEYDLLNNLYAIEEIGNNRYGITRDGGSPMLVWDRTSETWIVAPQILSDLPVLYDGGDYGWYIDVQFSVNQFDINTFETRSVGSIQEGIPITDFIKYNNDLMVFTTGEGIWGMEISSEVFSKIPIEGLPGEQEFNMSTELAVDPSGNLWMAELNVLLDSTTATTGIRVLGYNPATQNLILPNINSDYLSAFGTGSTNHLMVDSERRIWISKNNGLVQYNPSTGSTKFYNQAEGLRHIWVLGTLEDDQGMIWLSTRYGISRLNPDTGYIRNYGRDDGLQPSRMNFNSFYKNSKGELFFGGVGGLSYFEPRNIRESTEAPPVIIQSLVTGEGQQNILADPGRNTNLEIQWGDNSINIEFISVNFQNPEEITYSYKLEGFHEDWVEAGTRRQAQFSNLPNGAYAFLVKARNADGVSTSYAASVSFTILPPWWKTWWAYALYFLILATGIFTIDRLQRRRVLRIEREKTREKELEQAKEIEKAYIELEKSHTQLKATQEQLVQQEKLASLGQLTAGIAHEIKNPLNFVNNFSELSVELVEEAKDELSAFSHQLSAVDAGKVEEALLILEDIETNLRKIHEHGSRADSIVKSMLQHSRGGDGKMELTSLNPLIKEYVNLAFHGMRAGKDPINVDIDLQLDESIGDIPLIAEDFSRAILNLTNNAFDAMRDKQGSGHKVQGAGGPRTGEKSLRQPTEGGERSEQGDDAELNYSPKLSIRTLSGNGKVSIEIEDNGPGIPDDIKDKILQPFFTTKKGTQGTGLGLSITNDIIKAHGGFLDLRSSANRGTIFTIKLPA